MWLDFESILSVSSVVSILAILVVISIIVSQTWSNDYVRTKALGWCYIVAVIALMTWSMWWRIIWWIIIVYLAVSELKLLMKQGRWKSGQQLLWRSLVIILLTGYGWRRFHHPIGFVVLFGLISLSDIVAYYVGTYLPRHKGFTSISPNKALSGIIGQIFFLCIACYVLGFAVIQSILIGLSAPVWDLSESYLKRTASIKDTSNLIPGHGGVWDRIDSSIISLGILGWYELVQILVTLG